MSDDINTQNENNIISDEKNEVVTDKIENSFENKYISEEAPPLQINENFYEEKEENNQKVDSQEVIPNTNNLNDDGFINNKNNEENEIVTKTNIEQNINEEQNNIQEDINNNNISNSNKNLIDDNEIKDKLEFQEKENNNINQNEEILNKENNQINNENIENYESQDNKISPTNNIMLDSLDDNNNKISNNTINDNINTLQNVQKTGDIDIDNLIGYEKNSENLTTINDLPDLINNLELQKITMKDNQLTKISEFFIFENLVYLDLSKNKIRKLENMLPLGNLEMLILSHNNIKNIKNFLFGLKKLQHLDLSYNLLEINRTFIKSLENNIELSSIALNGNINYNFENTKYLCLEILMNVEYLDSEYIVPPVKKKPKINNTYIKVKNNKGKVKKIRKLNDYIKFKQDNIEEDNKKKNENEENNYTEQELIKNSSSYYYYNYLNNI